MKPACRCLGEWRLIRNDVTAERVDMAYRWFITLRDPDCPFAHEDLPDDESPTDRG